MRRMRIIVGVLGLALCAATASAQDPAKPPEAVTFEAAAVAETELPAGMKLLPTVRTASRAAQGFWIDPGYAGSLDAPPLRKSFQSFQAQGGVAGSVLLFEYDGAVPSFIQRVAEVSMRGGEGSPKPADEIVVHRNLMWIVSFPYGDPAAEWFKGRLRTKFGVPALRAHAGGAEVLPGLWETVQQGGDFAAGVAAADAALKGDPEWAMVNYLKGELCQRMRNPAGAEAAYRRASELHEKRVDPLPDNIAWAAQDGVGISLLLQKRYADAATALAQSLERGRALRLEHDDTPLTAYGLGAALAQLGRWDEALVALTDAVRRDPALARRGREEPVMEPARKRPEFRVLLEMDPPKRASPPPVPKAPPGPGEALTFDAVTLRPSELPSGWRLVKGSQCVSTSVHRFHRTGNPLGVDMADPRNGDAKRILPDFPAPKRKSIESLVFPDGSAGSIVQCEYESDVAPHLVDVLEAYLWGKDGRSWRSPEQTIVHGRFLWVLSFPQGHPAAEWWSDRLRRRFRVPVVRTDRLVYLQLMRLNDHLQQDRPKEGIRVFDTHASLFAACPTAWFFRAELAVGLSDSAGAEAAYGRAVALHDSFSDSLGDAQLWASLDGLGAAILLQKRPKEALPILERARDCPGRSEGAKGSGTDYNLACAYSLLGRFDEALASLKTAIAAKPEWKAAARDDGDFVEARKRADFQKLLAD